jgi:glycosyltransferase involved in cell wall biosynthesis
LVVSNAVVLICTHNPEPSKLHKVLESIRKNSGNFRVVLIDNASTNSAARDFQIEYNYRYINEPRLGNSYARFTALKEVNQNELAIFVDDDNYIQFDYIEKALLLFSQHPDWGCFGGKQIIDPLLRVPRGMKIFMPYIGIRELGPNVLEVSATKYWSALEPIGAGMCISPDVVRYFLENSSFNEEIFFSLGRRGSGLLSGEDSFIARQAAFMNLKWGYSPELVLEHSIKPDRLKFRYFSSLLVAYGRSDVILNRALNIDPPHPYPSNVFMVILQIIFSARRSLFRAILGLRFLGQFLEFSKFK